VHGTEGLTGKSLVYELDEELKPLRRYYL